MGWRERLRRKHQGSPASEREEWLATADTLAQHLTETGSRCHLNDGRSRFCHWEGTELPAAGDGDGRVIEVGVRCTIHPGGRYLDSTARLDPGEFA